MMPKPQKLAFLRKIQGGHLHSSLKQKKVHENRLRITRYTPKNIIHRYAGE